jgi:hypothetical protein
MITHGAFKGELLPLPILSASAAVPTSSTHIIRFCLSLAENLRRPDVPRGLG